MFGYLLSSLLSLYHHHYHLHRYGPLSCICVFLLLIQVIDYDTSFIAFVWILVLVFSQNEVAKLIGQTRNRMLKHTDERVKLVNESLQGIRIIKLYGWEFPMESKILDSRRKELGELFTYLTLNALLREVLFIAGPLAIFFYVVYYVYSLKKKLTVVTVFQVLSFINILRFPLNLLAQSLKMFNDATVSVQRLQKFFLTPTLLLSAPSSEKEFILAESATFSWAKKDEGDEKKTFPLENINFRSKDGELVGIIGPVGCGKSTLINSFLGNTCLWSGEFKKSSGCIAYCSQTPWIQNLSLRDNVLFGLDYEQVRIDYEKAVDAAALIPDFNQLPSNDLTEIGERGINLSGGQKARGIKTVLSAKIITNIILFS